MTSKGLLFEARTCFEFMLNQGGCDLYEIREDSPKLLYTVSVVCLVLFLNC